MLIYQLDPKSSQGTLAGLAGLDAGSPAAPRLLHLTANEDAAWPLQQAQGSSLLLEDLSVRFPPLAPPPGLPSGTLPPQAAALFPLRLMSDQPVSAVLIAGLSPHRPFDVDYKSFLDLVVQQLMAGQIEARARQLEGERLERIAELDRTKTEFFANVSHEFRTPLTLLLAPLEEMLQRRHELPLELAGEVDAAARNSRRLLRLVNSLLDFSEIETRRQRAQLEPTNLCELTQDVACAFRSAIERAGLRFDVQFDERLPAVPVNRDMWEKVVSNLLSNALKFTFDGVIAVRLRALSLHAQLEVQDSGVGIPKHELPNIFKRFHRVRGTQARTVEGSGMGLAIVHDLVSRMSGQLTVRSVEGRGTTFTIWMPFKTARLSTEEPAGLANNASEPRIAADLANEAAGWLGSEPVSARPLEDELGPPRAPHLRALAAKARVLIADDNADMRDYLRRLLGNYWQVSVARDGVTALAAARADRPDLVLADVMMPRMDGFELLRALRGDEALKHTRLIFLTATAGEDAAVEGLLAGADDYLAKPFSARELIARVGGQIELARTRRRTVELNEFLVRFSDSLRASGEPRAIAETACRMLQAQLRSEDATWSETLRDLNEQPARGALGEPFCGKPGEPFASSFALGRCVQVDDAHSDERLPPELRQAMVERNVIAELAVPVLFDGKLQAVLAVAQRQPRPWTAEDIALLEGAAGRCWAEVERARAETALRESEEKLRGFVNATSDTVYEMSADWRRMNFLEGKATMASTQTSREGWTELYIPEQERGRVWSAIHQAIQGKRHFELEHQVLRADGTTGWTASRAIPILDARGVIAKWFGAASDITERKRAEEALRDSEARHRLALDAAEMGTFLWHIPADKAEADTRALSLLGFASGVTFSLAEAIQQMHEEDRPAYARAVERALEPNGDGHFRQEARFLEPEGSWRWLAVTGQTFFEGQPRKAARMFGTVVDVTARARAEQALRESEAEQRVLLRLSDATRPLRDPEQIKTAAADLLGVTLKVNRAFYADVDGEDWVVGYRYERRIVMAPAGRYPTASFGPWIMELFQAGATLVFENLHTDPRMSPDQRAAHEALEIRAAVAVPLVKEGALIAICVVHEAQPRRWASAEIRLVQEVAERTWAAVERARAEAALRGRAPVTSTS